MKPLTIEKVLFLHQKMISTTGGANGIRDVGLLDSAISRPLTALNCFLM